jgi:hypothetical protein
VDGIFQSPVAVFRHRARGGGVDPGDEGVVCREGRPAEEIGELRHSVRVSMSDDGI